MSQDFISLFPFQNAEHWINVDDDDDDDGGAAMQALSSGTLASLSPAEQVKYLVDTVDQDVLAAAPAAHQHIVRAFARVARRHPQLFHLATASSVNPDVFEDAAYASKFDKYSGTYGEITLRGVDVVLRATHKALREVMGRSARRGEGAGGGPDGAGGEEEGGGGKDTAGGRSAANTCAEGEGLRRLHFYDLGSGVGKVPLQAVLGGYFARATGIELAPDRHRVAELCLAEVEHGRTWPPPPSSLAAGGDGSGGGHGGGRRGEGGASAPPLLPGSVRFVEGDVTQHWTFGDTADAAYISNLLFGDELNATVGRALHFCKRLKVVVSILAIPLREDYFCLRRRVPLHVSWQDEPLQGFLYTRVPFADLEPAAGARRSLAQAGAGPGDELAVGVGLFQFLP